MPAGYSPSKPCNVNGRLNITVRVVSRAGIVTLHKPERPARIDPTRPSQTEIAKGRATAPPLAPVSAGELADARFSVATHYEPLFGAVLPGCCDGACAGVTTLGLGCSGVAAGLLCSGPPGLVCD